jgi:tetratricopeptide (TPR) repeat protein
MTSAPRRLSRADWLQAALIAAVAFALYALTTPRTVAFEDDGLFVLAAYFLGVAHPPGYPLFVLVGKLFTFLPFGSVAYRVHLASGFFGGLSCALLWLCARTLLESRAAAALGALGLAFSPVFWSQAIIAEVYTLNTFFFLLLTLLALRGAPLPWLAFLFGLSLTDHWPLMGLVAPGFLVLLWPRRQEFLRRLPLLTVLGILGLAPYAWMVVRSWQWLPISYYGPLETLADLWHMVSRAGYESTDRSISAGWLDRIQFFEFLGAEVLRQFAVVGTLIAALGFALQRRLLGGRIALFLTIAFVMPTVVLLVLLRFDYDLVTKHVFHVYPLPAYAVAALWLALGFAWLEQRYQVRPAYAASACVALLALILAVGSRPNLLWDYDWEARYAKTVLRMLPKDAVLFVRGDVDLAPIAYLYLVEGWRPDIELYHSAGRVLGNRLFQALRTNEAGVRKVLREFIEQKNEPIEFTLEFYSGYAHRDHWLTIEVDKSSREPKTTAIEIPEEALRFFEESIAAPQEENAWVAFHQDELRRRYASLLAQRLQHGKPPDERSARHLALLLNDFYGALGIAEGLLTSGHEYAPAQVADALDRAARLMPSDATKAHRASYFYLRGALRLDQGDKPGAIRDFQTALQIWPSPDNRARRPLQDLTGQPPRESVGDGLQPIP